MTNANNGPVISTVEGTVEGITFKPDRNGKEFVTVSVQQAGSNYPTNVRSRDTVIIQRMVNAKKHRDAGTPVWLRCEVKETPRSEGGVFRDITQILRASLDGAPQEPDTEDSRPAPATASASAPASWTASIDERIAWNSAINNAVNAVAYAGAYQEEFAQDDWVVEVDSIAHHIYALIRRGPTPPAEDAPEPPVQAPDPNVGLPVDPMDGETPLPSDIEEPALEVYEV
jgi:hypothetical protein